VASLRVGAKCRVFAGSTVAAAPWWHYASSNPLEDLAVRTSIAFFFLLAFAACGGSSENQTQQSVNRDSVIRARDSVIGESNLPGAAGVKGAMAVADSAAARNARLDSIGN